MHGQIKGSMNNISDGCMLIMATLTSMTRKLTNAKMVNFRHTLVSYMWSTDWSTKLYCYTEGVIIHLETKQQDGHSVQPSTRFLLLVHVYIILIIILLILQQSTDRDKTRVLVK